jgi:hypothetical protein
MREKKGKAILYGTINSIIFTVSIFDFCNCQCTLNKNTRNISLSSNF